MAKKALIEKQKKSQEALAHDQWRESNGMSKKYFSTRAYTRCKRCGRPRAVLRKFGLCRLCFREMAHAGEIPGVTKASW